MTAGPANFPAAGRETTLDPSVLSRRIVQSCTSRAPLFFFFIPFGKSPLAPPRRAAHIWFDAGKRGNEATMNFPTLVKVAPISGTRKVAQVQTVLRQWAEEIGVGQKFPTVKIMCERLDVAIATLNLALKGLEEQGIVERKHGHGIYVSPNLTRKRVALIFGKNLLSSASPFFSSLVAHCETRAMSHGERFSLYLDVPELESRETLVHQDLAEALSAGKLNGILAAAMQTPEREAWLCQQGIPVVHYGEPKSDPDIWSGIVKLDIAEMIQIGVRALRQRGCRKIGILATVAQSRRVIPFQQAFRRAIEKNKLSWCQKREHCIVADLPSLDERDNYAEALANDMLRQCGFFDADGKQNDLDGLIVADDSLTGGVCRCLEKRGLIVGRDILVASHANRNSTTLKHLEHKIIAIEFDLREIAEALLGMLEKQMAKNPPRPATILIKPRLRLS